MATRRIKKLITEKEYKMLVSQTKGDEPLKEFNQKRFLMIFWLLYYSGARVNELSQIKYSHIIEIIQNSETVVITYKTKK